MGKDRKQTRTEQLVRRLCAMLRLDVTVSSSGEIVVCPIYDSESKDPAFANFTEKEFRDYNSVKFRTWRQCLFGSRDYYGLLHRSPVHSAWSYADDHTFSASSLDELELGLAIRGF